MDNMSKEKALIRAWVEALQSGEYTQVTGILRADVLKKPCYCALGVLADVAIKAGVLNASWVEVEGYGESFVPYELCLRHATSKDQFEIDSPGTLRDSLPSKFMCNFKMGTLGEFSEGVKHLIIIEDTSDEAWERIFYGVSEANDYGINFEGIASMIEKSLGNLLDHAPKSENHRQKQQINGGVDEIAF